MITVSSESRNNLKYNCLTVVSHFVLRARIFDNSVLNCVFINMDHRTTDILILSVSFFFCAFDPGLLSRVILKTI